MHRFRSRDGRTTPSTTSQHCVHALPPPRPRNRRPADGIDLTVFAPVSGRCDQTMGYHRAGWSQSPQGRTPLIQWAIRAAAKAGSLAVTITAGRYFLVFSCLRIQMATAQTLQALPARWRISRCEGAGIQLVPPSQKGPTTSHSRFKWFPRNPSKCAMSLIPKTCGAPAGVYCLSRQREQRGAQSPAGRAAMLERVVAGGCAICRNLRVTRQYQLSWP